ncbi:hypothetical protein AB0M43_36635 [Longispora sp. NPDC051575]|uniref:hypothetical protein n=1 Tax=Longispora sp. NPDC051575 TaxID=3154943 RepID=UPI0034391DB2
MTTRFGFVPAGTNWRHNALVGQWYHDDSTLARGFQRVADLAVQNLLDTGIDDGMFAPIALNYRHAIELLLKEALREGWACLDHDGLPRPTLTRNGKPKVYAPDKWLTGTHDLTELATELDACLAVLRVHPADRSLPNDVSQTIKGLALLDPAGDAFRYTEAKNTTPTTFQHLADPDAPNGEAVNVEQLREVCGTVINHLSGAVDVFIMYRQDPAPTGP